jgi:hypothetical protein
MFFAAFGTLKIRFNDKKDFNILDLEKEIRAVIRVVSIAEAITSDDKIDNFMVNTPIRINLDEVEERFGKRILVKSVSHNSPTLLTIIVSYKVAEILLRYFDQNKLYDIDIDEFQKNRNISRRLLADFITALEMLREIIEEISKD